MNQPIEKPIPIALNAPHTHRGKRYRKGDSIEVTPAQAEWLLKRGLTAALKSEPTTGA